MKTARRTDLPRYVEWNEERTSAGQFDVIDGVLLGAWGTTAAARKHLEGKRLNYGLGFFASSDSLRPRLLPGGLIAVEFNARGLFAEKFKDLDGGNTTETRTLNNVTHPFAPSIPSPTVSDLEFTTTKRSLEIVVACRDSRLTADYNAQARPLTSGSHWPVVLAGRVRLPDVGVNPFLYGDATYHYPYNWSFVIQPIDSLGTAANRLAVARFIYTHQWAETL